jgi:hypothetical protein
VPTDKQSNDEFERRFGNSQPEAEPRQPGEFTQTFFGAEISDNTSAEVAGDHPRPTTLKEGTDAAQTGTVPENAQNSSPGEFTRHFGGLNTIGQAADSSNVVSKAEDVSLENSFSMDFAAPSLPESAVFGQRSGNEEHPLQEEAPSKIQEPGTFTKLFQLHEVRGFEEKLIEPHQAPEPLSSKYQEAEAGRQSLNDLFEAPPAPASEAAQPSAFAWPAQSSLPQSEANSQGPHKLSGFTRFLNSTSHPQVLPQEPQAPGAFTKMVQKDQLPPAQQLQDDFAAQDLVAPSTARPAPALRDGIPIQGASGFSPDLRPATDATNLQSGPSEFTRVVTASAMRAVLSEQNAASLAASASASTLPAQSGPSGALQANNFQSGLQPSWPAPTPAMPSMSPPAYSPTPPAPPAAMPAWPGSFPAQLPSVAAPPSVPQPQPQPAERSVLAGKWTAYMPLILALNGLLLLAILLIVIFALSRK